MATSYTLIRGLKSSSVAATLGRIVVKAALVEHLLLLVAKRLLNLNIGQARLMFANARWNEYVSRIERLAEQKNFDLKTDFTIVGTNARIAETRRNLLVHSVWAINDLGTMYVHKTKGSDFAFKPERIPVTRPFLDESMKLITRALQDLTLLEKRTSVLVRASATSRRNIPVRHPRLGQTVRATKRPPK